MTTTFTGDKYVDLAVAKITDICLPFYILHCNVFIFQLYFDLHRIRMNGIRPFEKLPVNSYCRLMNF